MTISSSRVLNICHTIQEEPVLGMFDPEEGSTYLLRNVSNHLRVHAAQHYRRLESLTTALR
jgi:hypothetical protein